MARQNRRNREAIKLGTPLRFVDRVLSGEWVYPPESVDGADFLMDLEARLKLSIESAFVVDATAVCRYQEEMSRSKQVIDVCKDIPGFRLPHAPLFVECEGSLQEGKDALLWGCLFEEEMPVTPVMGLDGRAAFITTAVLFPPSVTDKIIPPQLLGFVLTDKDGSVLEFRSHMLIGKWDEAMMRPFFNTLMIAPLLAVSFMNFKGVEVCPHDPNPVVNQARRKNGKKPFLRYHTIEITSARKVIGKIDPADPFGFRKALHACRGHWAIYKDSFMGRKLDKPLVVWRPAHLRGSIKEGVVLSDYRLMAHERN